MKTIEVTDREAALIRTSLAVTILDASKVCETDRDVKYVKELTALWRKVSAIQPVRFDKVLP